MAEILRFDYPLPHDERIHAIWDQISAVRHDVYADELHQYDPNSVGKIEDPGRHFIACVEGGRPCWLHQLESPGEQAVSTDNVLLGRSA